DGMTITGALIRTASSGQRIQFDVNGLRAFGSNGAVTATISSGNGGFDISTPSSPKQTTLHAASVQTWDGAVLSGGKKYGGSISPGLLYLQTLSAKAGETRTYVQAESDTSTASLRLDATEHGGLDSSY